MVAIVTSHSQGLSGKDPPFQNYFFYDGTQGVGIVDNYTSKN
jgi:hypothetical protein